MRYPCVLAAVLTVLAASPAIACRDPTDTTAEDIKGNGHDAVVLARVETVTRVTPPYEGYGWNFWDGTVKVQRTLRGKTKARKLAIASRFGPGSCPPSYQLPQPGDYWVLYLKHSGKLSAPEKVGAYPLSAVRWADPSLKRILPDIDR